MKSLVRQMERWLICFFLISTFVQADNVSATTESTLPSEPQHLGQILYPKDALRSVEEVQLVLEPYHQYYGEPALHKGENSHLHTLLNHLSNDAVIQLEALAEDTFVYIQYFTDIDGDGNYEWTVANNGTPYWDTVPGDSHISNRSSQEGLALSQGERLMLTAGDLISAGLRAEYDRSPAGETALFQKDYLHSGEIIFSISFAQTNFNDEFRGKYQDVPFSTYYFTIDQFGEADHSVLGAASFQDVSPYHWYYEAVDFCLREGLFSGFSPLNFAPEEEITQAMLFQSLYNYHGAPEMDVAPHDPWYQAAYLWAEELHYVSDSWEVDTSVSAQTLLEILYRIGCDTTGFTDLIPLIPKELSQEEIEAEVSQEYLVDPAYQDIYLQLSQLTEGDSSQLHLLTWGHFYDILPFPLQDTLPSSLTRAETSAMLMQFLRTQDSMPWN